MQCIQKEVSFTVDVVILTTKLYAVSRLLKEREMNPLPIPRDPLSAPSGFLPQFTRLLPLNKEHTVWIPFFDPPYELDDDGNRITSE